jgi:triosephosphate isomerase
VRTPIVGGNWKMHRTRPEARELLRGVRGALDGLAGVDVVVCPPAPWLVDAATEFEGSTLQVGAQNVHWEPQGAFTGEVSAPMLAGTASYVIVGHSERRHVFGETDEQSGLKLRAVLDAGLSPILAVGELEQERRDGRTGEVLERQLGAAFRPLDQLPDGFVIAYEPVWAIGTGLTATPEVAQEACAAIRGIVASRYGAASADSCRIQYGGSVNAENIEAIARQPDIDGALVGGASLQVASFAAICRTAAAVAAG